ncbi:MAG: RNA polymerase sigma factor [Clostridia bacterium]|jgi:RNA polymerase sigma factor (sigma-70 family)|nr:RNA polymerase sigma factor [Clostridia bacterium]
MDLAARCVELALAGNDAAFADLVNMYKPYVFAIIMRYESHPDQVENIAQEVFLQIYRSLSQCRKENVKAWIATIAMRKAIDHRRKAAIRLCNEDWVELESLPVAGQEINEPETAYLFIEQEERVRRTCAELPSIYGEILKDFYLEGKKTKEIAAEHNIALKTVDSRLYRGRLLFKTKWEEEEKNAKRKQQTL